MISDLCTIPSYITLISSAFLGCSAIAMFNFASKNKRIPEFKEATSKMWFCLFSTSLAVGCLIGFYYVKSLNNSDPKNIQGMEALFGALGSVGIMSNIAVGTALFSEGSGIIRDMFSSKKVAENDSSSSSMDTYSLDSMRSV